MHREWPLTGRTDQWTRAATALRESGGVVLAGAAGVGKTRLAREVLAEAGRHGRTTRWIGATASSRGIPLGAFAALIGELSAGSEAILLGRLGGVLREDVEVLVVDDAHLLDDVSATLLHQLAVERATRLVVTVRSGETAPDAVTALWKDGLLARLDVPALAEPDTVRLIESVLGGRLEDASGHRLFTVTSGNVLLLRHLVAGEQRAGRLVPMDGLWWWTGKPEITPELGDLIDARIGLLSEPERRLLELVAFGEPLEVGLLATLVEPSVVEAAAERGLITVEPTGRRLSARLGHPLYGDAVRTRTGPIRARRRRGELAAALAATGARRIGDALRQAVLSLDSDLRADAALLTSAATEAARLADWVLAERLLRAATEAGGGFEPRVALGQTLSWVVRPAEAEVELGHAAALASTGEQHARVAALRAINRFFLLAEIDQAYQLLEPGSSADREAGGPGDETDLLRLEYSDGLRALFAAAGNRLDDAREYAARVLDQPKASSFAATWAGYGLIMVHSLAGQEDRLDALVSRVVAEALNAPETAHMQFNMRYFQAYGLGLAGRPGQARESGTWLRDLPGRYATMARDLVAGRIALDTGEVRSSARLVQGVLPFFPGHGGGWTALLEAGVAQAFGMAGIPRLAREALARAEQARHPGVRCMDPELILAGAWVAAAEGGTGQAIERALRAAELAGESGQFAVEVVARHAAVCFGDTGQAARLTELAGQVDGPRAPAAAAHAAALAGQDPDALLAASAALEEAELVLLAADAAAQAATLLRTRAHTAPAAFATARAAALAQRCEGARTPALRAGTAPLPISAREREVATLAATGLSNREIAARLHVSVRTVEGHVYRACTRLGLPDRVALAALVAPPEADDPVSRA
ncbi:MAG TPA: LuxR C-terminal-related transcriptional regulator [Pseudonocardia sp.]|uniref:LuxR C-terminal-related transcriptional regulator n=1 Tax=Pseudonocardia sp. TaxID=60912 RepID=UPI002CFECE6F|nr:LuxR C-terminal-related transcriptional regulator [Pseudonocardia sp.]HTF52176.1 LuxR C-terminal-related transcriptional regulator [Pseudonocardia sp.]